MPASTFEIIAKNWEDSKELFCKIANTARLSNLWLSVSNGDIQIRLNYEASKCLAFEIRTKESLDLYYQRYPSARNEPEERIALFIFDPFIKNEKYYSIAMANNYLDSELIWVFTSKYLADYPEHVICLNREIFIDADRMARIVATTEYFEGWCFKLNDLLS